MTSQVSQAECVSDALIEILSRSDHVVDHYRSHAEWALAIVETLAIIANSGDPMPAAIADDVRTLVNEEGVNPKLRRASEVYLSRIRVE